MSSEPTPSLDQAAGRHPAVEFVAANRPTVGWVLIALGLICLVLGAYCFYKGSADLTAKTEESAALPGEKAPPKIRAPYQTNYIAGGTVAVFGALVGVGVGGWLLAALPRPTEDGRRAQARVAILAAGGLFGLLLMLAGLLFLYLWFGSLMKWVDERKASEAKWILIPILVFLFGAGLVFLSIQPARDEERNNPFLRRLVYGANLVLTTLLLVLLLLVGNVFAALRVPNRLDTTESGMRHDVLSPASREYLANLDKTLRAYVILPESESPIVLDIRRLLAAAHEANPQRFSVRSLSPTYNATEIAQLRNKYPQIENPDPRIGVEYGVLLTVEGSDKQAAFIRADEMVKVDTDRQTGESHRTFEGEAKLDRELLALSEGKAQPVVYFTQTARELNVIPPGPGTPGGSTTRRANDLRAALEKVNFKVAQLPEEPGKTEAKVPDDADILAVADPLTPLAEQTVAAIRKFMTAPRPGGKKGRLIVLAGAHPTPLGGSAVMNTGLEPLLAEFGINLKAEVIYGQPRNQNRLPANMQLAVIDPQLVEARNSIALAFEGGLLMPDCRPVEVAPAAPTGARAQTLMITAEQRYIWVESAPLPNPEKAWNDLIENQTPDLLRKKQVSRKNRSVAAIASDADGAGRVVVFGSGNAFADPMARLYGQPLQAELFTASANWLRDRPTVANVAGKTYDRYTPKKDVDSVRLVALPVGFALLGVLALGFGVWVFRRQ